MIGRGLHNATIIKPKVCVVLIAKEPVRTLLSGLGVSLAIAVVMLATLPYLAIGWDEGYTLGREARLRDWFRGLRDPVQFAAEWRPLLRDQEMLQEADKMPPPGRNQLDSRSKLLFDHQVLEWFWPFARDEPHGHPPFYALLGLAGDILAPSWQDLPRARLGPILLFSLTGGAIYCLVSSRWGIWAAALAAGSWVLQPQLFGHGHYAAYDAILTSLWLLSIIAFARAIVPNTNPGSPRQPTRWGWVLTFGLVLGCAAATKFTGWFLPLPFLVWSCLYRSRAGFKTLLLGGMIAMPVLFALMPPWWTDPVSGVIRFLESNLSRATTRPIEIQFLGTVYNTPRQSLPWYNTLVWTVFVTPVGFLVMAGIGFLRALRLWRGEPIGLLIAGHWIFLMLLRALPHTPGHDGVRLFLPAFGALALLCGLGARSLLNQWGRWAKAAIVAALLEGTVSIVVMMPVSLSYFSPLVGGLPGASALGMEPTYYWDALSPEARNWLTEHTEHGRTIVFATNPHSWLYLRRVGALPTRLAWVPPIDRGLPKWYVLQNRPGAFSAVDRSLVSQGQPAYTVTKLGIPLIWIFPVSEIERLNAQSNR
jgi:4-amino-4-deoxy-L-arabinose transferase-like glycosyltransferase